MKVVCMECQGDGEGTYACGVGWGGLWGFMVHVYVVHYRTWHCCHSYNHFFMNGWENLSKSCGVEGLKLWLMIQLGVLPTKWHTYQPPTDHLLTTYWPPTDHLLTTYQSPTDHLLTTYQPPTIHLPTTYQPPTHHLLTTYQPPTNHLPTTYSVPTTYWPPTDHLLTTYQPPIDHLLTTY